MHWPRIRGLAASAGVRPRTMKQISTAPWALRLGKGLWYMRVTHVVFPVICQTEMISVMQRDCELLFRMRLGYQREFLDEIWKLFTTCYHGILNTDTRYVVSFITKIHVYCSDWSRWQAPPTSIVLLQRLQIRVHNALWCLQPAVVTSCSLVVAAGAMHSQTGSDDCSNADR